MGRHADITGLSGKTGIKLTYTTPPSADFSTKLNLAFASGDLPDIVYGAGSQALTASMEIDYGSQGILPLRGVYHAGNHAKLVCTDARRSLNLEVDHNTGWAHLLSADDLTECDIDLVARSDVVQRHRGSII